jgi:hypothetical protein
MQDYQFEVRKALHRSSRGVLSSNAHFINLSLAVVLRVNSHVLFSLPLSEVEDTSIKFLRIGTVTILGVKVVDDVERLTGNERLPSDVLLLIRHHVGQVRNIRWCDFC